MLSLVVLSRMWLHWGAELLQEEGWFYPSARELMGLWKKSGMKHEMTPTVQVKTLQVPVVYVYVPTHIL